MAAAPTTVAKYLAALPKERREAMQAVRKVILDNLDPDFEEVIGYGMPSYVVPHRVYPAGYHCDPSKPLPFASIASQKGYMSIYLFCVYSSPEEQRRFKEAWARTGKKLDMGKSCVRFKKVDDLALDVIGRTIKRMTARKWIAQYEAQLGERRAPARKKAASTKKKTAKKKVAKKKAARRRG